MQRTLKRVYVIFVSMLVLNMLGCGGGGGSTQQPNPAPKIAVDAGNWTGTTTVTTPVGTSSVALVVDSTTTINQGGTVDGNGVTTAITRIGSFQFVGGPLDGIQGIIDVPAGQTITSTNGFNVELTALNAYFVRQPGHVSATLVDGQKALVLELSGDPLGGQKVTGTGSLQKVLPTITAAPAQGTVGMTITITGTNFDVNGNVMVKFTGVASAVAPSSVSNDGTSLTVVVPAGATTGKIQVTAFGTETAESPQAFTIAAGPVITGTTPTTLVKGQSFAIQGVGFNPFGFVVPNDARYSIQLTDSASQNWTLLMPNNAGPGDTQISVVSIPLAAATGAATITVTIDGVASQPFAVTVQ